MKQPGPANTFPHKFLRIMMLTVFCLLLAGCNTTAPMATTLPAALPSLTPTQPVETTVTLTPPAAETLLRESISPDERWKAQVYLTGTGSAQSVRFVVSNDAGALTWEVERQPFSDSHPGGFAFPRPLHWSADGRYLYFSHLSIGDGCYAGDLPAGDSVQRVDLASGQVENIAPGGRYIRFSPDDRYLAAFAYGSNALEIYSLDGKLQTSFQALLDSSQVGMELDWRYPIWSPDGDALIYSIVSGVCDQWQGYQSWIVRADLDDQTQTFLVEADDRLLTPLAWSEPERILVRSLDQHTFWMDASDGRLTPIE